MNEGLLLRKVEAGHRKWSTESSGISGQSAYGDH